MMEAPQQQWRVAEADTLYATSASAHGQETRCPSFQEKPMIILRFSNVLGL